MDRPGDVLGDGQEVCPQRRTLRLRRSYGGSRGGRRRGRIPGDIGDAACANNVGGCEPVMAFGVLLLLVLVLVLLPLPRSTTPTTMRSTPRISEGSALRTGT